MNKLKMRKLKLKTVSATIAVQENKMVVEMINKMQKKDKKEPWTIIQESVHLVDAIPVY